MQKRDFQKAKLAVFEQTPKIVHFTFLDHVDFVLEEVDLMKFKYLNHFHETFINFN